MFTYFKRNSSPILATGALLFIMGTLLLLFSKVNPSYKLFQNNRNELNNYPELQDINGKNLSFEQLSKYFTKVAETKGAAYALDVLKVAQVPPNTDMHLLGHVVGDILFKQEGVNGIYTCTQDFRNACSHSIVVGLFLRDGDKAFPEIAQACRKAPGGSGAYTMCFHGLGHGVLAAFDYDLPRAASECQKVGTQQYNYQEAAECIGGTVMETIGGGFHNRQAWEKQRVKYLLSADPLSPCNKEYIPEVGRVMCYTYLTPWLFEVSGMDFGSPTPQAYPKAFSYCNGIPQAQVTYRTACFGGFGKEFTVIARGRDIRAMSSMPDDEMKHVFDWCSESHDAAATVACINSATNSLYWGGENDRRVAIRFCSLIPAGQYQSACFANLIGVVQYYSRDSAYKRSFCGELPTEYQQQCAQILQ